MMADIQKLNYSKNWTSASDFPSVEPDEAQARADMQYLFDEVKGFINETLIPAVPSESDIDEKVDEKTRSLRITDKSIGTSWSGSSAPYVQTIQVAGVEADSIVEVSLRSTATAAQAAAYNALLLQDGGQTTGAFTLRCFGTKNTITIPINIVVRRD